MDTSGVQGVAWDDGHVEEYRELVGRMDMSASLYVQLLREQTVVVQYKQYVRQFPTVARLYRQQTGCTVILWRVQTIWRVQIILWVYIQYS
jgi:hypothetical protein